MSATLFAVAIQMEEDMVAARRKAREIATILGFDPAEQTRIATAVSEVARDAFTHSKQASAEFLADLEGGWFWIQISGKGRTAGEIRSMLESDSAAAYALAGAQRLLDDFHVKDGVAGGAIFVLGKRLPTKAFRHTGGLDQLSSEIARSAPRGLMDELRHENRELLRLMDELRERQEDLARLNSELEHTNRGVLALYQELDEKAEKLRRADQMKSRFLSHMSHEFRTPLTSIMALGRLLTDEVDGPLSSEQRKQAMFIRKSAESLLDMVNELLEMARLEAGKSVVRPAAFRVADLFSALQGMFKPLRGVLRPTGGSTEVELVFEEETGIPDLYTDESKVAQILRNFISNALKFTENGRISVRARLGASGRSVIFSVIDTGIGIPASQLPALFQEFSQLETALQRKVSGSGLGLSLAKGLAELLGGSVGVESELGKGSTFSAEIPLRYRGAASADDGPPVLVVDDEEVSRYLIRQALGPSTSAIEASSGASALELAKSRYPRAILLDLNMPGMNGYEVLRALKEDPASRDIPVVVLTAQALTREQLEALNGHASLVLSKELLSEPTGPEQLRAALMKGGAGL